MYSRIRTLATVVGVSLCAAPALRAQGHTPHLIVVQMIAQSSSQFVFLPAAVQAAPGDTLRFEQTGSVPHDVDFKKWPNGAKLGSGELVPYLTTKGVTYDLIIDKRFVSGVYKFVCDPHEPLGMVGTLTVSGPAE